MVSSEESCIFTDCYGPLFILTNRHEKHSVLVLSRIGKSCKQQILKLCIFHSTDKAFFKKGKRKKSM